MPARPEDREVRHQAIRELLVRETLTNQEDLVARLEARGIRATQSGVSRDLRLLGVIKQKGRYRLPEGAAAGTEVFEGIRPLLRSARTAGPNIVVCQTEVGSAPRAALTLDRAALPEIVGTIAGDDTIFIAVDSSRDQSRLLRLLRQTLTEARS